MKKLLIVSGAVMALLSSTAFASNGLVPQCDGPSCTICDLIKLAHNVINYAIQISFVLAIAMVVFGGYTLLTSAGSEEKVTSSRKIMWYAVLGLALVLASWAIVNTFFLIVTKAPSKWPWNEIPGNCAETGISTDISGEEVKLRTRSGGVPRSIDVNPAGALEPQGPTVTSPSGEVHAPTAPAPGELGSPEIQGPPRPDSSPIIQPSPNTTPFPSLDDDSFGA